MAEGQHSTDGPPNGETPPADTGPKAGYVLREPEGWVDGVAMLSQHAPEDYRDLVVLFGSCPRCTHRMEVELPVKQRTGKPLATTAEDSETLKDPFAKTASCNCRGDHEGRPKEAQGCGAFGRLEVGAESAPDHGIVRVKGKPFAATLADLEWERKAERLGVEELTTVRATGEKWTATVSSLTGIFGVVALIKGPEDITKLDGLWEASVIILVLFAIALALTGVLLAAFAAYGMPRRFRPLGGPLRREQTREAGKARRFLAGSVGATVGAVSALAIAIGITWGATPEETPKQNKAPAARNALLTAGVLDTFRGPVSVRRTVPPGQKNDRLCLLRYQERTFKRAVPTGSYWTSCDEKDLRTLAKVRERLALPPRMTSLPDLRLRAELPEGTKVTYFEGKVAPQCAHRTAEPPCKRSRRYAGGGSQYYFPDKTSPSKWITERACTTSSENKPTIWKSCNG